CTEMIAKTFRIRREATGATGRVFLVFTTFDVERLTRRRFDRDPWRLLVALGPVTGSPGVAQLLLGCPSRRRGVQERSRFRLARHKTSPPISWMSYPRRL